MLEFIKKKKKVKSMVKKRWTIDRGGISLIYTNQEAFGVGEVILFLEVE